MTNVPWTVLRCGLHRGESPRKEVDLDGFRSPQMGRHGFGRYAVVAACRIVFDRSKCASMGLCEMVAPDMFQLNDDGVMTVQSELVDASRRADMEAVAMGCPTNSLSVVDA